MKKLFLPFLCIYISGYLGTLAQAKPKAVLPLSCQSLGIKLMGESQVLEADPITHKTKSVLQTQEITTLSKDTEAFDSVYFINVKQPVNTVELSFDKKESQILFKEKNQRVNLLEFNSAHYLSVEAHQELTLTLQFKNKQKCQLGVKLNEID